MGDEEVFLARAKKVNQKGEETKMPIATTTMTDSEKVLMLILAIERMRNERGCWCQMRGNVHVVECQDMQAAIRIATKPVDEEEESCNAGNNR